MFVVTVTFTLKPGARGAFLALVTKNAETSLALEPGCRRFDVCTSRERSEEVFLYEVYDDEQAFAAHRTMPHYHEFNSGSGPLVAGKTVQTHDLERTGAARSEHPTSAILKERDRPRISRAGGASTVQMVTPESGAGAFLNGFTDIPPGAGIALHFHNCEESVLIVAGRATVEVDGETFGAEVGDVTWLPGEVPHRFVNPSETEPLRIFWTYASTGATRTLVETGETAPILAERGLA